MAIRHLLFPLSTILITAGPAITQDITEIKIPSAAPIPETAIGDPDMSRVKALMEFLCNDQCEGRLTASPGERIAGNHLADFYKNLGLQGMKSDGKPTPYHQAWNYNGYADQTFFTTIGFPEAGAAWLPLESVNNPSRGTAYNIGAILPGSDPSLRNEYIVLTGHYDHLGKTAQGICRGASDNASGTVAVAEVAACLKDYKPKRSILFLNPSGEEKGLLGSNAFINNCPIPVSSIKVEINMDMIGNNTPAGILSVCPGKLDGKVTSLVKDARELGAKYELPPTGTHDSLINSSDHSPFDKKNIPFVYFMTGNNPNFHKPGDTPDKLDYNRLMIVIKIARDIAVKYADSATGPAVIPKSEWSKWEWKKKYEEDLLPAIGGPRE